MYGLSPGTYPLYLVFLGDIDGDIGASFLVLRRIHGRHNN